MNTIIKEDLQTIINTHINWHSFTNKTIVITGATGMLGSYMAMTLLYLNKIQNLNIKIIAIGRNRKKFDTLFKDFIHDKNLVFEEIDIIKIGIKLNIYFPIHYIIHAASPARSDLFAKNLLETIYPNMMSTNELLKIGVKNKIDGFLFFSTGDIYGKIISKEIIEEETGILDPLDIRSVYGESKRMAETLCKAFAIQYNVPTKIARIFHTYGPSMDIHNDSRIFADFIRSAIEDGQIIIKGNPNHTRSFCYIVDTTIAFFKILLHGNIGEAYNVANRHEVYSIKELANTIAGLVPQKSIQILCKQQDNSLYLENKNANANIHVIINTQKLESLNWKPMYTIKDGFERTIKSFLISVYN